MAENTKIQWCDHTINLWWGCAKVHTGCKNCYAEFLSDTRYSKNLWGEKAKRQRILSSFKDLDKYQRNALKENKKFIVFCGSMMDIFEESKDLLNPTEIFQQTADLRNLLFYKIDNKEYENLIFLFLTKRPENIINSIPFLWIDDSPKNVWFGTSISNQETTNILLPHLIKLKTKNLFLSVEPQVGDISFRWASWFDYKSTETATKFVHKDKEHYMCGQYDGVKKIAWVIQGGESGTVKRPFDIEWAYNLKQQCKEAKIPYFFKQIDKVQAIPKELEVREFPEF